jgi:hypothetical protein
MRLIEFLNKLTIEGTLDSLYSQGVIGYHWLMYRDIYNLRDLLLKQGHGKTESIYILSIKFRIENRQIYNALKKMEQVL